jgi:hypothetical protein
LIESLQDRGLARPPDADSMPRIVTVRTVDEPSFSGMRSPGAA